MCVSSLNHGFWSANVCLFFVLIAWHHHHVLISFPDLAGGNKTLTSVSKRVLVWQCVSPARQAGVKQLIFHMIIIYSVRSQVVMKKWQMLTRARIWLTTIFWTIDAWKQEGILLLKIKAVHSCEESFVWKFKSRHKVLLHLGAIYAKGLLAFVFCRKRDDESSSRLILTEFGQNTLTIPLD